MSSSLDNSAGQIVLDVSSEKGDSALDVRKEDNQDPKRSFSCKSCSFSTNSFNSMIAHLKASHERFQLKCGQCSYVAKNRIWLKSHIENAHGQGPAYKCPHCSYVAKVKVSLISHVKAIHEKLVFRCQQCSFSSSYKTSLATHVKAVHEDVRDFECRPCNYATHAKRNLLYHLKSGSHASRVAKEAEVEEEPVVQEEDAGLRARIEGCSKFSCVWCGESNEFGREEMEAHLMENHSLTLKEYFLANFELVAEN